MTDQPNLTPPEDTSLDAIRAILSDIAQSQQRTQDLQQENAAAISQIAERLDQIAASQEQFQADFAQIKTLIQAHVETQKAFKGILAELQSGFANMRRGFADMRVLLKSLIDASKKG